MLDIPDSWSGGIDALVAEANRWLGVLLPEDRLLRLKDEVNPRLVRHYTTQQLLPSAERRGRDAWYTRTHLLALLAMRRLMAEGLSGPMLAGTLADRPDAELAVIAEFGFEGLSTMTREVVLAERDAPNRAVQYLTGLKQRSRPREAAQAAPLLGVVAMAPRSAAPRVSRTRRVHVRPGLEVLVDDTFEWPDSQRAWRALMDDVQASLHDAVAVES